MIDTLQNLKDIRSAELKYEQGRGVGKFGTLKDLVDSNLIQKKLEDGIDMGYEFNLKLTDSKYSVQAIPLQNSWGERDDISFYLDETGVIRANYDRNTFADASSEAINNQ